MNSPSPDKLPQEVREAIEAVYSKHFMGDETDGQALRDAMVFALTPLWHRPSPAASALTLTESAKISREVEGALVALTNDDDEFRGYDNARSVLNKFATAVRKHFNPATGDQA